MTTDETNQQSPFTRPGFLVAAAFVVILVVVGIVLGVTSNTQDDEPETLRPTPTAAASASADPSPSSVSAGESICALEGEVLTGTVTIAPPAEWQYQGTIAYPTSEVFGPAEASAEGIRSCFQHSPEGALFAAANGAVQATDSETVRAWLEYFLAEGPYREDLLGADAGEGDTSGTRIQIAGFKVLNYDGDAATIDIGLSGSVQGQPLLLSGVFYLVWEDGDWKLEIQDPESPIDYATIPDLSGYIPWAG